MKTHLSDAVIRVTFYCRRPGIRRATPATGSSGLKIKQCLVALLLFVFAVGGLAGCNRDATYTVAYIVRHAEVDYSGGDTNPSLTEAGRARALALRDQLKNAALVAIYQTELTRTRETAAPVAADQGLTATEIAAGQNQQLVDHILANHAGQAVLIVNHSHNILDIISAFGAERPFDAYPNEFDKFFILIHSELDDASSAGVFVTEYGAASPPP